MVLIRPHPVDCSWQCGLRIVDKKSPGSSLERNHPQPCTSGWLLSASNPQCLICEMGMLGELWGFGKAMHRKDLAQCQTCSLRASCHSSSQQTFSWHVLCARHCLRPWRSRGEQSLISWSLYSAGGRQTESRRYSEMIPAMMKKGRVMHQQLGATRGRTAWERPVLGCAVSLNPEWCVLLLFLYVSF